MAYKNVVTLLAVNLHIVCFCIMFHAEATQASQHFTAHSAFTRLKRMETSIKASTSGGLETQIGVGVPVVGEDRAFFMTIGIGTPPVNIRSRIDTASDLIWFDCSALPADSSTFKSVPCPSSLCSSLPNSTCSSNSCQFSHNHITMAGLFSENFTMRNLSRVEHSFGGVAFGCSEEKQGEGVGVVWNNNIVGRNGVVGLGRGVLSFISQIGGTKFSYCLLDDSDNSDDYPSRTDLLFGSVAELNTRGMQSTVIMNNTALPQLNSYYYLSVEGISVGNVNVNVPRGTFDIKANGSGGFIIDSATPYTVLPHAAIAAVAAVMDSLLNSEYRRINGSRDGFSLCYQAPTYGTAIYALNMTIHMGGGAEYVIEGIRNFVKYTDVVDQYVVCLAILDMREGSVEGLPAILGNFQQRNYHILYDNGKERLSFAPSDCLSPDRNDIFPKYAESKAPTLSYNGLLVLSILVSILWML